MNSSKSKIKDLIRSFRIQFIRLRMKFCQKVQLPSGVIAIIAPHPDDEVLGCGGLIQRLTSLGHEVYVIFLTGGEGSHKNCCDVSAEHLVAARRKLSISINHSLGVKGLHHLQYPDGGICQEHNETNKLKLLLENICPSCVLIPHWGEGWRDHIQAAEVTKHLLSSEILVYEYCVWVWYYNIWKLDWKNATVLCMNSKEHRKKVQAVNHYIKPKAPCGNPWSGVLPPLLINAAISGKELFFKSR